MKANLMPSELVTRFDETQTWCSLKELNTEVPYDGTFLAQKLRDERWSNAELESHLILGNLLRSAELEPSSRERLQSLSDWAATVEKLAAKRSLELMKHENRATANAIDGQIVLYAPQENLFDGAAQVMSLGFFDVDNTPPWDTWIGLVGPYLLAWVPKQMVGF